MRYRPHLCGSHSLDGGKERSALDPRGGPLPRGRSEEASQKKRQLQRPAGLRSMWRRLWRPERYGQRSLNHSTRDAQGQKLFDIS